MVRAGGGRLLGLLYPVMVILRVSYLLLILRVSYPQVGLGRLAIFGTGRVRVRISIIGYGYGSGS